MGDNRKERVVGDVKVGIWKKSGFFFFFKMRDRFGFSD